MKKIVWLLVLFCPSLGLSAMGCESDEDGWLSAFTTPVKGALSKYGSPVLTVVGNALAAVSGVEDYYPDDSDASQEKEYGERENEEEDSSPSKVYSESSSEEANGGNGGNPSAKRKLFDEVSEDEEEESGEGKKYRDEAAEVLRTTVYYQKLNSDCRVLDDCLSSAVMTDEAAQILVARKGQICLKPFINAAKKTLPGVMDGILTSNPRAKKQEIDNVIAWATALEQGGIEFDGDTDVASYKGQLTTLPLLPTPKPKPDPTPDNDLKKGTSWFSTRNLTVGGLLTGLVIGYLWFQSDAQHDRDSRKGIKI